MKLQLGLNLMWEQKFHFYPKQPTFIYNIANFGAVL